MTHTETPQRPEDGPAILVRALLTSGVTGAGTAAVVVGLVIGKVPLWTGGIGALLLTVAVLTIRGSRKRARKPAVVEHRALARIESRRATGGESADVPIAFDLTVAPEEGRAFRVSVTQPVNLVDIPAYPPRRVVVVEYPADEPWSVRILTDPDTEWVRRAEAAEIDPAPESTRVSDPTRWASCCLVGVIGLLVGAGVVIVLFRGPLFHEDPAPPTDRFPSSAASAASTSQRTTTVDTAQSLLDDGRLRATVDTLIAQGTTTAVGFRIEDRHMALHGTGPGEGSADHTAVRLATLPYERLPALVREARTTLGVHDPDRWHIDIANDPTTHTAVIRVTVTGSDGSASLTADEHGGVTHRDAR